MTTEDGIGLCASCRHVQVVPSRRDATFYLCRLSAVDPHFRKYPQLPVVACTGWQRRDPVAPGDYPNG